MAPISDVATLPPPPPEQPPQSAVTSVSPTASPIASSPETSPVIESMAPVALPAPEPAAIARWEAPPAPSSRIWLPGQEAPPESVDDGPPSGDIADSWSGIAPTSSPGMSQRTKTVVWATVSASLAIIGIAAYQLLDRSPEARSTATVLAPKMAPPSQASAAPVAAEAPKGSLDTTASTAAGAESSKAVDSIGKSTASSAAASVPTSVAGAAPSATGVSASNLNRPSPIPPPPPRPMNRAAPPSAPAPSPAVAPAPVRQTPPAPPPSPKPKPKEDLFGI
jgi:hypothetical protein